MKENFNEWVKCWSIVILCECVNALDLPVLLHVCVRIISCMWTWLNQILQNMCDDERKKNFDFFLQPNMSGIKIEICSTVLGYSRQCLYGLYRWKELEQNSAEAKSLMPQGYISNYIKIIETSVSFL